jgi:transcriptional regulator with XRE-family HTH domain
MLSPTLADGLNRYKIGPKIRALRSAKGMGLVQLAEHTGLSPALLSKIERGQLFTTLPTLLRIAMVFGVGLDYFFTQSSQRAMAITRRNERIRLADQPDADPPSYLFENLNFPATDRKMSIYLAEFPANSKPSEPHQHPGVEFIYVVKGRLVVNIDEDDTPLAEGDAMQFDSGAPHSYRRQGHGAVSAIVVVVP